jgi:hypothetical protein
MSARCLAKYKLFEIGNKTMLMVGDPAPETQLETMTDEPVSLAETWRKGHHALLIFLRHLG